MNTNFAETDDENGHVTKSKETEGERCRFVASRMLEFTGDAFVGVDSRIDCTFYSWLPVFGLDCAVSHCVTPLTPALSLIRRETAVSLRMDQEHAHSDE